MSEQGIPVYTPPQLFMPPSAPDDWIRLVAEWIHTRGGDVQEVGPNTISGNLIKRQGPQWAQRLSLGEALGGALDTAAAREVRAVFQSGTAISLAAWGSFERFRGFCETLRKIGGGRYIAGLPPNEYDFLASNDFEAYQYALAWCADQRKREIQKMKEEACRHRDQVRATSRIIVDIYQLLLVRQGLLLTANGDVVTWENGAHGLYACEAKNWCYGLECSPGVAVAYYLLALQDRGDQAAPVNKDIALSLLTAGMPDWKRTGPQTFSWKGGALDGDGVVTHKRQVVGQVAIRASQNRGRIVRKVVVRGRGNKILDEGVLSILSSSNLPAADDPKDQDLRELAMAWGVCRALDRLKRQELELGEE